MTKQTEAEVIKALAYGKNEAEIADIMSVPLEDIKGVDRDKVAREREYLRSMGYMK